MTAMLTRRLPDCRPLLADPDDLTLVFQPIVDLARARVAGYEALARFPGTAGPDVWFAAAEDSGVVGALRCAFARRIGTSRTRLNTYLTGRTTPSRNASAYP